MRIIILLGLFFLLAMTTAYGGGKDDFWDKMQSKLEKVTPAKKAAATTAVGGVRGARNEDGAEIYWKGKDKGIEVNEEELLKFNLAMESRAKGDNELALKHFDEFLGTYPQSSLRVEGLQAAEQLRKEIAALKNPPQEEKSVVTAGEPAAPPKESLVATPTQAAPAPQVAPAEPAK